MTLHLNNTRIKVTNQITIISGIVVILAIATIAASYNVQTAEARSERGDNFGQNAASEDATNGGSIYNTNPHSTGNGLDGNSDDRLKNGGFGGIVGCAIGLDHC
jgi:hypothetical protein